MRRLGGGPLAHERYAARREWDGTNRAGAIVAGLHQVLVVFADRARNEAQAKVEVAVCDGPCD